MNGLATTTFANQALAPRGRRLSKDSVAVVLDGVVCFLDAKKRTQTRGARYEGKVTARWGIAGSQDVSVVRRCKQGAGFLANRRGYSTPRGAEGKLLGWDGRAEAAQVSLPVAGGSVPAGRRRGGRGGKKEVGWGLRRRSGREEETEGGWGGATLLACRMGGQDACLSGRGESQGIWYCTVQLYGGSTDGPATGRC